MYIEQYREYLKTYPKRGSKKIKILLDKLYRDIQRPATITKYDEETKEEYQEKYIFDEKLAHRPIKFIESFCVHSKGKFRGTPFKLEVWQKAFIESVYGFVEEKTKTRRYKEAQLYIGRKNGKTTLAGALGIYHLMGEGEGGSEVYSVATKKDQSKIAWTEAKSMVQFSRELTKRTEIKVNEISYPKDECVFKPLASDSNSLDGLNAQFVIADEIHAWKDANLFDVMYDSMASREQPLILLTTTMGFVRQNIFDDKYEFASKVIEGYVAPEKGKVQDNLIAWIFELDSAEEIYDTECWYKANPGLGTIKKFNFLKEKVDKALQNTSDKPNVLAKDFNVIQTERTRWLDYETTKNLETFEIEDFKNFYAVGGVDLSSTTDLTSATLLIKKEDKYYVLQQYFIPEHNLEHKIKEDKVPYDIWEKRGLVTISKGASVDYSDITEWYNKIRYEYGIVVVSIGYDPWSSTYWIKEVENKGFQTTVVRQGAQTLSTPMKYLEAQLKEKKIIYNNNPILQWCLTNTEIKVDDNDNIRPVKGKNNKERIDGTVSLLNALVVHQEMEANLENMNRRKYGV